MRRSLRFMTFALAVVSTPLAAQSRGWTAGIAATVGDSWEFQCVDIGLLRPASLGPLREAHIAVRLGSFSDDTEIFGGMRGFVGALALGLRTAPWSLAEVGHEGEVNRFALDIGIETAGYVAAHSPLPEGDAWLSLALLPGARFGRAGGTDVVIIAGPALFIGRESDVHAFVGVRVTFPLTPR